MSASVESRSSAPKIPGDPAPAQLVHRRCFACGAENPSGLHLQFSSIGDDEVECALVPATELQGYEGILQGGIVATLLDSAMTNALFRKGITARTAEMRIRFRHPVPVGKNIIVRAKLNGSRGQFHRASARVLRAGRVLAEATGKFMEVG